MGLGHLAMPNIISVFFRMASANNRRLAGSNAGEVHCRVMSIRLEQTLEARSATQEQQHVGKRCEEQAALLLQWGLFDRGTHACARVHLARHSSNATTIVL